MNDKSLICVVTGATGGIGYHLACGFQNRGYKVVALDKEMHRALPEGIDLRLVDALDESALRALFQTLRAEYGALHVLVNNAAIAQFSCDPALMTTAQFDAVIGVNLRSAWICAQEFIRANAGQSYGRIINIASTRWNQNEAGWEAYGASKGALVSLTNSLCVSLADTPITVNAISPGWINTHPRLTLTEEDHAQHPSGRVGIPRDIVNAALFLAHEENDFINGHNLVIDGGMTKKMIYHEG